MPTGFTAAIADDISFEHFVWKCARGMSALIMMRDDPMDAPIPDAFPASTYNAVCLQEARARLAELSAMTPLQVRVAADTAYATALSKHEERRIEKLALRRKYEAMLEKVKAWEPPSMDHVGLKAFMIEQITSSIDFDCSMAYDTKPERHDPEAWHAAQVKEAYRQIEYHSAEQAKEEERTAGRNRWVKQLRDSVPPPMGVKP